MIRVIVNADDFGLDENRTKAILEAYRMKAITTTTAMSNMPWFERAVEMARGTELFSNIGLHLTLTEGMPLTERIRKCPRFCNPDGSFNACFHRHAMTRLFLSKEERAGVAEEAEAQMAKYIAAKLPLRHLDSHHHSHTDWSVARVVMPIAKCMGFKTVRRSRDMGIGFSLSKGCYKFFVNRLLGRYLRFATARFGSIDDLMSTLLKLEHDGLVEVMTHPLYRNGSQLTMDGTLMDGNRGNRTLSEVVDLWRTNETKIRLCNYGELKW